VFDELQGAIHAYIEQDLGSFNGVLRGGALDAIHFDPETKPSDDSPPV
jgi:hypothetical protein